MNASFGKEWRQIAPQVWSLALAGVVATTIWGPEVIEVGEPRFGGNDELRRIFALFAFLGAAIGYYQFQIERGLGTESYLVHRGGGHAAAFRAKFQVAWIAWATWVGSSALAFVARTWLFDPAAPLARWSSLVDAAWASLGFVPAHAMGVLCAQLRAGVGVRVVAWLTAVGGTIVAAITVSRDVFDRGAASVPIFLATLAAITLLARSLAWRMFAAGDDRDVPHAPRFALPAAAILLASAVPLIENVVGMYQRLILTAIETRGPVILADADRELFLARELAEGWFRVDADTGAPTGPKLERFKGAYFDHESPYVLVFAHWRTPLEWNAPAGDPSRLRVSRDPFLFSGSWQHVSMGGDGEWTTWLASADRSVVAYRRSEDRLERAELARPDGRTFSERTVIVYGGGGDHHGGALVDLGDGSAWRVEHEPAPRLVELALPDGDAIVGVEMLQSRFRARTGSWEPFGYSDRLAVLGRSGKYIHAGDGFLRWDSDEWFVAPADFDSRVRYRVERAGGDRVSPVIAVLDGRTGAELFRHAFGSEDLLDSAARATIRALGLARSPLTTLAGLLSSDARARPASVELPLHAARPIWILHFALVAGLLFDVRRRLSGAGRGTRLFWLAATLLLGPVAWAACRGLEPRRAAPQSLRAPEPKREPLLVTA